MDFLTQGWQKGERTRRTQCGEPRCPRGEGRVPEATWLTQEARWKDSRGGPEVRCSVPQIMAFLNLLLFSARALVCQGTPHITLGGTLLPSPCAITEVSPPHPRYLLQSGTRGGDAGTPALSSGRDSRVEEAGGHAMHQLHDVAVPHGP